MEVRYDCHIEKAEKRTKQFALIVETNAKFHSNLIQADQFTAESVGQKEGRREEADIRFRRLERK